MFNTLNAEEKRIYNQISSTPPNEARCKLIMSNLFQNVMRGHLVGLEEQLLATGACNDFRVNFAAAKLYYTIRHRTYK